MVQPSIREGRAPFGRAAEGVDHLDAEIHEALRMRRHRHAEADDGDAMHASSYLKRPGSQSDSAGM